MKGLSSISIYLLVTACRASVFSSDAFTDENETGPRPTGLELSINDEASFDSDGACRNNPTFYYNKDNRGNFLCRDVHFTEFLRLDLCRVVEINNNCPLACGLCCEDDPKQVIYHPVGVPRDCAWLSKNPDKHDQLCDTFNGGQMVRAGCPKTCNYCRSYVSVAPSNSPSESPTDFPTSTPTALPTSRPSFPPSSAPSPSPTKGPTVSPTEKPSTSPTQSPTTGPTVSPTEKPSIPPTALPTQRPSLSSGPTTTQSPSEGPTALPSLTKPSSNPSTFPSEVTSFAPTEFPTMSIKPSPGPTDQPSQSPSSSPSLGPSPSPTNSPTDTPTVSPTRKPTESPTPRPTFKKPNLLFIMTDEHNIRTLSSYRDYLLKKHPYNKGSVDVWGEVSLDTPFIDSLARDGAMYTNFYTVAPLCTPSRASFMTGQYPSFTEADGNHEALNPSLKTWAQVLREKGYKTSYMGKWHLDGRIKPGWGDNGRPFGFADNQYRWNRGHWKYFDENLSTGKIQEYTIHGEGNFVGRYEESFATDFLVDRGIEFMEETVKKDRPFALMLSIPDPHGPNENRPYYRQMYENLHFKVPVTARKNMKYDPAAPMFNFFDDSVPPTEVDDWIEDYENSNKWQRYMNQYYGMVKCIDYNMNKLLGSVKQLGIEDDTVVVFTSDHGDLLMEHGKLNKGRPYEMSAKVPFIVRYPGVVPAGKIIETAYSSVDFAPTILSLMGFKDPEGVDFQGVDGSAELISKQMLTKNGDQIIISYNSGKQASWAAAIKDGYKLVIHKGDVPWLFDINRDPDEMINYAQSPWHEPIFQQLKWALADALAKFKVPMTKFAAYIYMDTPACFDKRDVLPLNDKEGKFCEDIGQSVPVRRCENQSKVAKHCPVTCNTCCRDSTGVLYHDSRVWSCNELKGMCDKERVRKFCPQSCNAC